MKDTSPKFLITKCNNFKCSDYETGSCFEISFNLVFYILLSLLVLVYFFPFIKNKKK